MNQPVTTGIWEIVLRKKGDCIGHVGELCVAGGIDSHREP